MFTVLPQFDPGAYKRGWYQLDTVNVYAMRLSGHVLVAILSISITNINLLVHNNKKQLSNEKYIFINTISSSLLRSLLAIFCKIPIRFI